MSQRRIEPPVALSAFHELICKHGIPKLRYDGSKPEDAVHARRTEAIVNLNHIVEPSDDMLSVIPKRGRYSWIRDDVAFAVAHGTMPERFQKKALLMLKLWDVSIPRDYGILLAKGERYEFHNWHVTDAGLLQFHWNTEWDDYTPLFVETSPKRKRIPVSEDVPVETFIDYGLFGVYHEGETCGLTLGNGHWDVLPILKPSAYSRELVNAFFTSGVSLVKSSVLRPGVILAGDARWMPEFEKQGTPVQPIRLPFGSMKTEWRQ